MPKFVPELMSELIPEIANSQQQANPNDLVFVSVSGQGPNLVLLHGWGLHGGIWQTVLPELEKHFTVYNVDLPGFGRSAEPLNQLQKTADTESNSKLNYDLEFVTESVVRVLPEKFNLIGWSLGGVVATAIASRYSKRVAKLITVASSPCFVANENWPHAMKQDVLTSFIEYLNKDYRGTLIKFLSIQTMGSPTQKQDIAQLKQTVFEVGMPSEIALKGGLEILDQVNFLPILADLQMPLLRIYGRLDSLVPVKAAKQVADYSPNSQAITFKKSGHAPFLSESDLFLAEVLNFIKTVVSK
jgi:pimeloyl-[acyl-carrier protein] methyl ester esterase